MNIIIWSIKLNHAIDLPLMDIIFFSNRICPVWNKLPEQIVSTPNLTAFKTLLRKFDFHTLHY